MSYQAQGCDAPETVLVVARKGGAVSDVWLRKDVAESDDGEGGAAYTYTEAHIVATGAPSADEVEAAFDEWWEAAEDAEKTDSERIAELQADNAVLMDALAELAELVGGE